jgi:hypothetical protein
VEWDFKPACKERSDGIVGGRHAAIWSSGDAPEFNGGKAAKEALGDISLRGFTEFL